MILFFDTETTGLPVEHLPIGHEDQPHVVQLAAILTEDDGTERASINLTVHPDGWTVPDGAARVHGITTELAARTGIRAAVAAVLFGDLMKKADLLVAHNIKFDRQLLATLFARTKRADAVSPFNIKQHCTMEQATPLVNLPPTDRMILAGINKPKSARLEECVKHFFGQTLDGAHDALVDVRACARIYFHMNPAAMGAAA
jgi:DNA polymerase III subunit epsilon